MPNNGPNKSEVLKFELFKNIRSVMAKKAFPKSFGSKLVCCDIPIGHRKLKVFLKA